MTKKTLKQNEAIVKTKTYVKIDDLFIFHNKEYVTLSKFNNKVDNWVKFNIPKSTFLLMKAYFKDE